MKKGFFNKYVIAILALVFLGFLLMTSFLLAYTAEYFRDERDRMLDGGATALQGALNAIVEHSDTDFDYLISKEKELLRSLLESQQSGEGSELFISDGFGEILIATKPELEGKRLSPETVSLCAENASQGKRFEDALDSLYGEKQVCRTLVMEGTLKNREGIIVISAPAVSTAGYTVRLLQSFLLAVVLIVVAFFLIFIVISRKFMIPLAEISRATEAYAKGDFSFRLDEDKGGDLKALCMGLNQMAQRVEKNESNLKTFVSNVSHDLRTPLTTIGGFVQNMMAGNVPEEGRARYYKIILDEVDRLSRLVQTLLETSRMSSGERKYHFEPMDLCELGRITLISLEAPLEEKRLEVAFETDRDRRMVLADRDAITRVIYNLMDNAVKFTPVEGALTVRITASDQKAFFAVRNSGEGIPEEEIAHLFDRFYKSDRSRGLDKKGMGLGLFIAKTIIDAHGEELWVESRVGDYTEFVFSLPLAPEGKRRSTLERRDG